MAEYYIHLKETPIIHEILLTDDMINTIKSYGKSHFPEESCGMLTGVISSIETKIYSKPQTWYPIDNVSQEKNKWDYVMDQNQYMEVLRTTSLINKYTNVELSAVFHTHPHGNPVPSQFDVTGAAWRTVYLIYGINVDTLAAWHWNGSFFQRIPINDEVVKDKIIYNDGKIERKWNSWKQVK